jgi:hypothetical protein
MGRKGAERVQRKALGESARLVSTGAWRERRIDGVDVKRDKAVGCTRRSHRARFDACLRRPLPLVLSGGRQVPLQIRQCLGPGFIGGATVMEHRRGIVESVASTGVHVHLGVRMTR